MLGRARKRAADGMADGAAEGAAIHAVVMGITLMLIAGTVAILIVLATKGLFAALVVLAVMIVMNQLEGHLLQPQVVGKMKMVRLHPLAVILVLAPGADPRGPAPVCRPRARCSAGVAPWRSLGG